MSNQSRTHKADGTPREVSKRRGEVRKLTTGINDLETLFPEIAKQLVDGDPRKITKGSNKKFNWKCLKGHIWTATVGARTSGEGCAVCAGKQINVGFNDLATVHPEIAKEADGWDPQDYSFSSNKNVSWKCNKGHVWKANINNRATHGVGCPFCSGNRPWPGETDLATTHPTIAKDLLGADPRELSFGSNKRVKWKCVNGHVAFAIVPYRIKHGCNICNPPFKNVAIGVNDLLTTHPEIAKQAHGWDSTSVTAGSGQRLKWICSKNHIFTTTVNKRTSKDPRNCPFCSNQKVLIGFNDLGTTKPIIAAMAQGWDPKTVVAGSNKRMTWACPKGHSFSAPISYVSSGGSCNICANSVILQGFNDIATTHAEIASQADGWDPTKFHIGSKKKVKWRCELGHNWSSVISSRKKNGCPVCGNRVVVEGFNDLKTKFPILSQEAFGWDPTKVAFATTARKKWKCKEGHTWESTVKNRSQLNRGCPSCATSGFDPNDEGWLYLLKHVNWQMLQVGITNHPERRMTSHKKLGWEVIEIRGPMDGLSARNWETSILAMLRDMNADLGNINIAGKFDGFSEAWVRNTYEVTSMSELLDSVRNWEDRSKN